MYLRVRRFPQSELQSFVRCRSLVHTESHSELTSPRLPYHTGISSGKRLLFDTHSFCPANFIWEYSIFLVLAILLWLLLFHLKKKNISFEDSALRSTPVTRASSLLWLLLTSVQGLCFTVSLGIASDILHRPPTVNSSLFHRKPQNLLPLFYVQLLGFVV